MIVAGIHNDFENPPNIPAFNGNSAKRTRRNGLLEVLNDAAIAFAGAIAFCSIIILELGLLVELLISV